MLVENFLECYHCAVAHPGLSDVIDVDHGAYRLERHPTFASHYAHVRERPREAHYDAAGIDGQFHLVWPSLKVNVMPGRAEPVDRPADAGRRPGRTDGVLDYFFAADEDPDWIADFMALDDEVGAEDRVLVESVQRGMAAGVLERGELLLPSEDLIAAFQEWVAGALHVARERERPRARRRPACRPRRRRGGGGRRTPRAVAVISRCRCRTRVRQAPRPSAELHCTRTLADSGSPSTMR